MKKLAFVLFVAILGLGMTSLAFAGPWLISDHVYNNVWTGDVQIDQGQKAKIVFHPQGAVDQANIDLAGGSIGLTALGAPTVEIMVKEVGEAKQRYIGSPEGVPDFALTGTGNVKVKIWGRAGGSSLNSAAVLGASPVIDDTQPPTAAPEPASMLLLGSGLVGMAAVGRRKFFKK